METSKRFGCGMAKLTDVPTVIVAEAHDVSIKFDVMQRSLVLVGDEHSSKPRREQFPITARLRRLVAY